MNAGLFLPVAVLFLLSGGCAQTVSPIAVNATDGGGESLDSGVVCGTRVCGQGQACCYRTGDCFDERLSPGSCQPAPRGDDPFACSSERDCRPTEFCDAPNCLGVGRCTLRSAAVCHPPAVAECGCDGVTYSDICARSRAGVRLAVMGACGGNAVRHDAATGVIGCGSDAQCPTGMNCCPTTGQCVSPSCLSCCIPPSPDGGIACALNSQCVPGTDEYCAGEGCGTVGLCTRRPSDCSGIEDPVCGCDGNVYTNRCWAAANRVRVASAGRCMR